MADQQKEFDSLAVALRRSKVLSTLQSQRSEPFDLLNNIRYDLLVMRAELTALRDMMMRRANFNEREHKDLFRKTLEKYSEAMSAGMGVTVLDDGRIIEGNERSWKQG